MTSEKRTKRLQAELILQDSEKEADEHLKKLVDRINGAGLKMKSTDHKRTVAAFQAFCEEDLEEE